MMTCSFQPNPIHAHVVLLHNPFVPTQSRDVFTVTNTVTITHWLLAHNIRDFNHPTLCLHNGNALLRQAWCVTSIQPGDVVTFITLPCGHHAGDKLLRSVLINYGFQMFKNFSFSEEIYKYG